MGAPALKPAPTGLLKLAAILLVLFVPAPSRAADETAARTLAELYSVALLMDAAVLDLNMLLGEDQSPTYKARLDTTIQNLEAAQKTSATSLNAAGIAAENSRAIETNVIAFARLMRENRKAIQATGVPENAVIDEMMLRRADARKALDAIYRDLEKRAGLTDSPLSEARALALLLQQMSALYVESASAAYGVSNRTQSDSDATIDGLARNFSERLSKLAARARGEESVKLVRSIESKWRFIEKSMLNYRERTVPYLVDRYAQSIVTDLVKLAEALEHNS